MTFVSPYFMDHLAFVLTPGNAPERAPNCHVSQHPWISDQAAKYRVDSPIAYVFNLKRRTTLLHSTVTRRGIRVRHGDITTMRFVMCCETVNGYPGRPPGMGHGGEPHARARASSALDSLPGCADGRRCDGSHPRVDHGQELGRECWNPPEHGATSLTGSSHRWRAGRLLVWPRRLRRPGATCSNPARNVTIANRGWHRARKRNTAVTTWVVKASVQTEGGGFGPIIEKGRLM